MPADPATDAPSRQWYLYLVEMANGSLYTGITTDIERRFAQHVSGKGARALRGKGPLTLRHAQAVGSHGDALRLEAAIKRLSAAGKRRWLERQTLSSYCHRNVISVDPPTP